MVDFLQYLALLYEKYETIKKYKAEGKGGEYGVYFGRFGGGGIRFAFVWVFFYFIVLVFYVDVHVIYILIGIVVWTFFLCAVVTDEVKIEEIANLWIRRPKLVGGGELVCVGYMACALLRAFCWVWVAFEGGGCGWSWRISVQLAQGNLYLRVGL